jgi:hypothetical protein
MSDLFPNLDALAAQLTGDSPGKRDARVLAEAVAQVATEDGVDQALEAVINTWRHS